MMYAYDGIVALLVKVIICYEKPAPITGAETKRILSQ